MKLVFLFFIVAMAVTGFGAYNDVSNLRLIQDSEDKNATYRYFNPSTFSLPEPKEITKKDKTKTLVINEEEIKKALEDATKKGFFYLGSGLEIYLHFINLYLFIALIFLGIGGIFGFLIRSPIDELNFEKLKEEYKKELTIARQKAKEAQETAKKAKIEAKNQAEAELENELNQLNYRIEEAEKERIKSIQAQNLANELISNAQRCENSRIAAIKAADRRKAQLQKQKETIKMLKEKLESTTKPTL